MVTVKFLSGASPGQFEQFGSILTATLPSGRFCGLSISEYWVAPLAALARRLREQGVIVVDSDPGLHTDFTWLLDLPDDRNSFRPSDYACDIVVLQCAESPVKKPFQWSSVVKGASSMRLHYAPQSLSLGQVSYDLPFRSYLDGDLSGLPTYSERGLCVAVNSRRRPTIKKRFASSCGILLDQFSEERWSVDCVPLLVRSLQYKPPFSLDDLVSYFSQEHPADLKLFGLGWDLRHSRLGFLPSRQPPRVLQPMHPGDILSDKLGYLSAGRFAIIVENICGDFNYVSEKIFDAMRVGCIPVYLGDRRFAECWDGDVLIDGSGFCAMSDLYSFMAGLGDRDWTRMSNRCIEFVVDGDFNQVHAYDKFVKAASNFFWSSVS